MATAGPNSPSTAADDSTVGTAAWSNTGNVTASDNVYALASPLNNTQSHYIKATGFGFAIAGVVNGITVEIERKYAGGGTTVLDKSIKLVKGGVISGTDKAALIGFGTADTYQAYGGVSDLWGLTLTDTDVNASNFGFVYSAVEINGIAVSVFVDHMRITVTYTAAGGPHLTQTRQAVMRAATR